MEIKKLQKAYGYYVKWMHEELIGCFAVSGQKGEVDSYAPMG